MSCSSVSEHVGREGVHLREKNNEQMFHYKHLLSANHMLNLM